MKKRIILKFGSNVLINKHGLLDETVIHNIAENIFDIKKLGYQVMIVSSGAIAAGKEYFGKKKPAEIESSLFLQMCSSLGQPLLMQSYINALGRYGIKAAQALFTKKSFDIVEQKKSMIAVLNTLLEVGVVPIVNENDVLTKEEIVFTDNDRLSAFLAQTMNVEIVVLFSNTDGLYDGDPNKGGKKISKVYKIDNKILSMVTKEKSPHGSGGMISKLESANILIKKGIIVYITNGKKQDAILKIVKGEDVGTKFQKLNKSPSYVYE